MLKFPPPMQPWSGTFGSDAGGMLFLRSGDTGYFSDRRLPLPAPKIQLPYANALSIERCYPMDKPHKKVVTTYPVAVRFGQGRVHVQNLIPWHLSSQAVKCPQCEAVFIMSEGFPEKKLLKTLETQHKQQEPHPDSIPSEPQWTTVVECNCGL
jgi:hypothetical protein